MDVSKEYIEMCTQAEEIQTKYNEGYDRLDWVYVPKVEGITEEQVDVAAAIEMTGSIRGGRYHLTLVKNYWLPRQDQLQELAGVTPSNIMEFEKINHLVNPYYAGSDYFNTWEKVWLGLVMLGKFRKKWIIEKKIWK